MQRQDRLNIFSHLIMPIILASLLFALIYGTTLDFSFASFLFELQGGTWSLQHHWLTEIVMHKYVRNINQMLVVFLLAYWLVRQFYCKDHSQKQRALGGLLLSLILSYIIVAVLKRLLPMECPWDLQQFGGNTVFWGLFDSRPAALATNQCFPAGHSSIGFAWVALYYYWRQVQPSRAFQGLLLGLSAGLLLGFMQQLRGAHFISHDIATATICWLVSTFQYLFQIHGFAKKSLALVDSEPSSVSVLTFTSVESADV